MLVHTTKDNNYIYTYHDAVVTMLRYYGTLFHQIA
jgi:hypothetical protein